MEIVSSGAGKQFDPVVTESALRLIKGGLVSMGLAKRTSGGKDYHDEKKPS